MGGLVSMMQTLESGDDFWRLLSNKALEDLRATPDEKARLAKTFYFHPNSSVKQVVTLGTPHRGSDFANDATRELGRRLIRLPAMMLELGTKLALANPGFFTNMDLLTTNTSIDSLAPDCPIFPVMLRAPRAYVLLDDAASGDVLVGAAYGVDDSARELRFPGDLMRGILPRDEESFVLGHDEVMDALGRAGIPVTRTPAQLAVAPLALSGNRVGCIIAAGSSSEHEFDEIDLRLLAGMAHQAALLIRG